MGYAVPKYLAEKLEKAIMPPGHWFNLFYSGYDDSSFKVEGTAKNEALNKIADKKVDEKCKEGVLKRQESLALKLNAQIFPVKLTSPLAVGLGNEHPVENGFSFLVPYGLPYIAGSGIKGVLRRAAELIASGNYPVENDKPAVDLNDVDLLFGVEGDGIDNSPKKMGAKGCLRFWDAFPDIDKMAVEVMTPHYSHYLNPEPNKEPAAPHDQGKPIPIPFLVVPSDKNMNIIVDCATDLIPDNYAWKDKLEAIVVFAGKWIGLGAKTAIGYGAFEINTALYEDIKKKAEEAELKRAEELRLLSMTPEDREKAESEGRLKELSDEFNDLKGVEKQYNPGSSKLNGKLNEIYDACAKLKSDESKKLLDEILKFVDKKSKKGKEVKAKIKEIFPEKEE